MKKKESKVEITKRRKRMHDVVSLKNGVKYNLRRKKGMGRDKSVCDFRTLRRINLANDIVEIRNILEETNVEDPII